MSEPGSADGETADGTPGADAESLSVDANPAPTTADDRPGPVMALPPRDRPDTDDAVTRTVADPGDGPDVDRSGEGRVRVVGTAHVSSESVREVERVIETERPEVVAVELDEGRFRQFQGETPEDLDAGDLLRGNTVFQFLAYWMLSYVQTRLGDRFDVDPGAEMRAAVEAAAGVDAGVALVDRDIQVTIQRFWARMTIVEKLRTVSALAFGAVSPAAVAATTTALVALFLGPIAAIATFLLGVPGTTMARLAAGGLATVLAGYATSLALDGRRRPSSSDAGSPPVNGQGDDTGQSQRQEPGSLDTAGPAAADEETLIAALPLVVGVAVGAAVAVTGVGSSAAESVLSGVFLYLLGGVALAGAAGLVVGAVVARSAAGVTEVEEDPLDLDDLTDADVVTALVEEFRTFSPGGAAALIDERDAYIAHNLVWLRERGYDVVAVVGAGHREGVERYLDSPESLPPFADLVGRERTRRVSPYRVVGYLFTLGFLAFFGLLVLGGAGDDLLVRLFTAWFLFNGVFAFAMAKLAGARWTSAGVGGAVAWFTSINPLLAPGWFVGYVELRYVTVNVADVARLNELVADETLSTRELVSELLDVPLFRLIAVVGMTNVGSLIATLLFPFVVLPLVAEGGDVATIGRLVLRGVRNGVDVLTGVIT